MEEQAFGKFVWEGIGKKGKLLDRIFKTDMD